LLPSLFRIGIGVDTLEGLTQLRDRGARGFPNDIEVDFKVPMNRRLRIPRIWRHGTSKCRSANSGYRATIRAATSPMVIKLMMTACWVRRSAMKALFDSPSTNEDASLAACFR
jgi:hypothetical protein